MYFSGQGKLSIAPIIAGVVGAFRWVGNVPDFKPTFDTSKIEHKEAYTGQRLLDKTITTENKSGISATFEDWSRENLALVVRGKVIEVVGGVAVTNEVGPATLVAGDVWALKGHKVTALTLKDSTAVTPLVPVLNTDYTVDPEYGTITIIDPTGFVLPWKANYTPGAISIVPFFTEGIQEVAVRFEGINTADNNSKVLVELYRIALDPTKELGLISEEFGQFVLEGSALIDESKGDDENFGKFGRLIYL